MKIEYYFVFVLFVQYMCGVHADCCWKTLIWFHRTPSNETKDCSFYDDAIDFKGGWCMIRICGNGRPPGSGTYCGNGPCNIFGCNCDDGCVPGNPIREFVHRWGGDIDKIVF